MKPIDVNSPAYKKMQAEVYRIVATIPIGKVATYGQIAAMAGDPAGAQEVGHIMSATPDELHLPCHRVVNQKGTLAPDHAFGGQARQRMLLENEGITFRPDGRIDMDRHLWMDDEQLSLI